MRWSNYLIPTLKEDPSETDTISQKLMIRAGLIRKLGSGIYNYLPAGFKVLNKAINIVREEMNRAGAQEILMPVLQPSELWIESERFNAFGPLMCKFTDRTGKIMVLGPTHEEVVTHIVRNEISSYKQLPINLYQIQTKFRDEIRPRFGVIRSKEFLMKDAYSFDTSKGGLDKSFDAMYKAYSSIFDRCGLKYKIVLADSGLMGGDTSLEFMIPAESGEDLLVSCGKCRYSANMEKAECRPPQSLEQEPLKASESVLTPGKSTIDAVTEFLKVPAMKLVKTLIYVADGKPVAVLVRGDHDVNETKLAHILNTANIAMADKETIEKTTGGPLGFSGPVGLKMTVIADHSVKALKNFVTGANKADTHLTNVNLDRDFTPAQFVDARVCVTGDKCPKCDGTLSISRGIEIGHIFKLGTKYSQKLGALYLDEKGASHPIIMGCYGIGVNRIIASALELFNDQDGIIWPPNLAPFQAVISAINPRDEKIAAAANGIYETLKGMNIDVLLDDRDVSAGVKFKDADLIGMPIRITVGSKTLKSNTVDVKLRMQKEQYTVNINEVGVKIHGFWNEYTTLMEKMRLQ
ncbi:MAG: proline--tRNA ligase [Planctomycetes bacterium]|nr:proline--tRNA ligase [Planctomycetota bacterium]